MAKWFPIPDKWHKAEPFYEKGGWHTVQTNANSIRAYNSSTTSLKFAGVSAFTRSFGTSAVEFSVYSITGSTSGYWAHAINYMMSYNSLYKISNYFTSLTAFSNIVVFNMKRENFGDRVKTGSFEINSNSISSITGINQVTFGTSTNFYLTPFFGNNHEVLIRSISSSLTGNHMGKIFPYNGFGILLDQNWTTSALAKNFVDSITSVSWKTELMTTEMHGYVLKEPFQINLTYNPSILKPLNSGTGSLSGYSYGRDGLTGASSELIATSSAFTTYATTIGFYNDQDECLIVAKLPQPIKLIKELPYSFKVVLDLAIR